jgi:uncharacterized repeat protein (TIGR02543 family)
VFLLKIFQLNNYSQNAITARLLAHGRSVPVTLLKHQMRKKITLSNESSRTPVKRVYSMVTKTMCTVLVLLAVYIAGCKKDDFAGEVKGVCPVVTTDPLDKAVDVLPDKVITATFNTEMDAATITGSSFTITQGTQVIDGTVAATADAAVYTFTPKTPLLPFTTYTGTITTDARDKFHSAMVENYVWSFTTIPVLRLTSTPPAGGTTTGAGLVAQGSLAVVSAIPNSNFTFKNWTAAGVEVSTSPSFTFPMAGNKDLVANFEAVVAGKFAVVLTSNPTIGGAAFGSGSFDAGTKHTITAVASTGYSFVNWTGDETGTNASLTFNINSDKKIVANFKLDPTNTNPPVIPIGSMPVGPAAINLGSAADFTILTKSGISTTGITSVDGDIGVSPAAASSITGFGLIKDTNDQSAHTPIVTGKVYAADYAAPTPAKMTTAVSDMETAFTTANGLTTPAPVVGIYAGDISGRILPPGLYKWSTGVLITNAGVTLAGGANDTWVLQIAQDLTVNSSAIVHLVGGAQAKNITWVVSGQATLGTNTDFSGTILSKTLISLNTGAVVTGKLLAQTAVTLNASTVKKP